WEIKIIVIKNERFNRYRDIIDDASLGSLLDWVYLNDKNLNIKGTTFFENTLDSTTSNDGSVVLKGGIGIEKNVNIGDSVTIKNNLQFEKRDSYFSGTRLSLKSEEILYEAIQDTDTISIQENTETFLDYSSAPEPQRIFKDDENNLVFLWYTNSTTITYEVYSLDIEGKYTEKIYSGSFTTLINMDMVDWDYPDNLISGSIPKGIIPYYTEDFDTYVFHNIYLYNYLTNTTQTYVIEDTGVNYADIIVHKNWFYVNIRKSEETTKYIYYYEDNTYWSNIFSEPISIYYPNPKGKDYIINSTNTLICLNGQYSSIYNFSGSAISKGTDVILSYSIGTATLGVYQWDELTYILLYLNTGEYNYSIITIDALFTTITITKALTNVIDAQITGSFFNTDFSGVEFILDKTKKLYYYSSVESGKTKFHLFDYDNSLQTVTYSSSVILTDETGTNKVTCFLPLNSNQVLLMYDYAGYPSYMFFKSIIYGCIPDWNESAIFFRDSSQIKIDTLNVKDIILTEIHEVAPTSEDGVEGQIWIEI
ncbi:MAG TPA: hypothetical protein PKI46_03480, partial [Bacteroidales bacterium]|nr:hypothetical protein [Bacteroidales bacterium]